MTGDTGPLRAHCKDCRVLAACRYTFGKFWEGKSGGGEGCYHPLSEEHARRIREAIIEAERKSSAAANPDGVQPILFRPSRIDEARRRSVPRKFTVSHKGKEYDTMAVTEEDAINNIRFKLYRLTPRNACAPFSARLKDIGAIPRTEIANRLAKFAS